MKKDNSETGFYDYSKKVASNIKRIKESKDIFENNKKAVIKFYEQCSAEGLSVARLEYYLDRLSRLAKWIKKDFNKAKKEDIIALMNKVNALDLSENTKRDYRIALKKFYKWLKKVDEEGEYPQEVKWIKTGSKNSRHQLPEELLNEEDIKKLVNTAEHPRDKALIFTLYESGCRVGEILSLKNKHLSFDKYGAVLIVTGKTGMRRVRVLGASPYLATWKNNHPEQDNPGAPLWTVIGTTKEISREKKGNYKFNWSYDLTYAAIRQRIKKIAIKAGIKKRVNPHTFRHSRATALANRLTEAQMKEYFGWVQSSDMAAVYVHMSGRDVDSALLEKVYGLKEEDKKQEETKLKPIKCPRCGFVNGTTAKFCSNCSMALDPIIAVELDKKRRDSDEFMTRLMEDKDIKEMLVKKIMEKGIGKDLMRIFTKDKD